MDNIVDISEVMICPNCKGFDCYKYDTDEIEFDIDGKGHYNVDCCCRSCRTNFRLYIEFNYSVTKAHTKDNFSGLPFI